MKRATLCPQSTTSGLTTNYVFVILAKLKTLLVIVAYRTDKHLSRGVESLLDVQCEDFVKTCKK